MRSQMLGLFCFFFSSRRRHTRCSRDWSSDVCSSDLDQLRKKAIEKGVLTREQQASEAELMQLIFVSGLSTAGKLTQLSGRGVGMDVVRSEIASIGGRVEIARTRGRGTTLTVYLPPTLAPTHARIVRAA